MTLLYCQCLYGKSPRFRFWVDAPLRSAEPQRRLAYRAVFGRPACL